MGLHGDKAYENFHKGYNCAQSVAMAFAPEMGLSEETAARYAAGFGGGMGRLREVCGAFSGVVFVLGALYGSADPADKTALYTTVQQLAAEYKARNGKDTIVCREMLGLAQAEGSPVASERTPEYYKRRPCDGMIRLAADIMEEYLQAHTPKPQTAQANAENAGK